MINVTKTYLPPIEEYQNYLKRIWDKGWLTNRGSLTLELEEQLCNYLQVPQMLFVTNGMLALQIAIKALELKGEIITTPFSYVATTTAILWEKCTPVFVDINTTTFCIDPDLIEERITDKTTAILATHVYGYPCDIEKIEKIAGKYGLKVIYDAAHCFGVKYNGQSIFNYGDVSITSFHATKLFHTIEGGGIFTRDFKLMETVRLLHQFGHIGDDYFSEGTNGKASEFQAAMGLCNLPAISAIIHRRKLISQYYTQLLRSLPLQIPVFSGNLEYNYAYYPVVFQTEEHLLEVMKRLAKDNINARRYFYPSLNTLPYIGDYQACQKSEDISKRVLCLPLSDVLEDKDVERITQIIKEVYE